MKQTILAFLLGAAVGAPVVSLALPGATSRAEAQSRDAQARQADALEDIARELSNLTRAVERQRR